MSDRDVIAAMQRHAAIAEGEHRRLVGELDAMRERAEAAEARLASISGVTREELVAAERAKRADLLDALKEARRWVELAAKRTEHGLVDMVAVVALGQVDDAIAKATT